jgi:transglutaminase-like putative cysteine protease
MGPVQLSYIAPGDLGVEQSLGMMANDVDQACDSQRVVYFARRLAVNAGVRQQYQQALAIKNWLARVFRFVDDPIDRDLFVTPDRALQEYEATGQVTGDCDEAATLGAALGRAVGMRAQFVVLGFPSDDPDEDGRFAHVFAVLLTDDNRSVSLDVTRPAGPVPAPSRVLTLDV